MLGIGWSELLLIAILTLLFVRPKDIPHLAKQLAIFYSKLKQFVAECRGQFETIIQESDLDTLRQTSFKNEAERKKAYEAILKGKHEN